MENERFIKELKESGLDLLARFLGITQEEIYQLTLAGVIDDQITQILLNLPFDERVAFEDELIAIEHARLEPEPSTEIQTTRVTRENIIETYLSVKRPNKSYAKAYARITSIVNVMNTQTNSQPVTSTIEYLQPGTPDDDMSVAIDRVYQALDTEFSG